MKKRSLLLLTLVPLAVGYLRNLALPVPGLGFALYYALPLAATAVWFWLGRRFVREGWKPVPALLTANAMGLVHLLLYLWQNLLVPAEARVPALTALFSAFTSAAPGYLLAPIAISFEAEPNTISMASSVALTVLSVLYMLLVFLAGSLFEKFRKPAGK